MNYIFLKDKDGNDRVIRTQKPFFTGTIVPAYHITEKNTSMAYNGRRIMFDDVMSKATQSKLEWCAKKALKYFEKKYQEKEKAFDFVKRNREFLNLSAIEKVCGIPRTGLTNAVNRNQNNFQRSEELEAFIHQLLIDII